LDQPKYPQFQPPSFEFSRVEGGTGENVHFIAVMDVTGYEYGRNSTETWQRFACSGILAQLSGKALAEVYEQVVYWYQWQLEQSKVVKQISHRRFIPVNNIRRVERPPLIIDDD